VPAPPTSPGAKDVAPAGPPQGPLATRVWKKVKHEAQHYWHGSKLLVSEVRIAARLQLKILRGGSLTRRERRQVCARAPTPTSFCSRPAS
jgi:LETM1 and EF-hand domain-containing protein 1